MMTTVGIIAFVAFGLTTACGFVIEDRICSRLRARHPELWQELGSPERFFDDGGLARRAALAKLSREPVLLQRCCDDIAR